MSIRNKVNVVNSVQFPPQLRRFIAEGNVETSAGIFTSGNYAWISNGDKLSIIDTAKGWPRPVYSFADDSKEPVDITCVEELVVDCTTPTPLLLVGTSSLHRSQLCVYNPSTSRVIRAIELGNLQVRCMTVVDDGRSSLNSLTDVLSNMDGVVALGCADGSVVLVDLNRQIIIGAYQGNLTYRSTESTPQPLKYVTTVDEEASIIEINEAQQCGASAAITIIEGDERETDFGVTALNFSRESACLYIGYSSGLWQIWNLSFPTFTMMYECSECTSPVSNFCQIEPCEDPRPTIYLWVNHEGTDSSMPLFNMYTQSYATKHHVHDYGTYYQDFISCSLSFSMYPGEEFANVTSGRLVSAASYSKMIKRHLLQNMGLPEMEGIQMKLVVTSFSLTYARGSTHTYLCIFDLDQWYKEQMPHQLNGEASYIETIELSSEPLLASAVRAESIALYHTEEPQEIHLVPQALSFRVIGLSETDLMLIDKIGLQKLWLTNTELIGAKSMVHPVKLFHACVTAGFVPTFPAQQNNETSSPTNEEMRSYIMSVCLDNGLIKVILDVGEQWETGVHAASNCSLHFLFDWVWSSVSTTYKSVNDICDTLFSASGHDVDISVKRHLQHTRLILDRLHYIHTAFYSKYNNALYRGILEQRFKAIDIITLFVHQVSWFVNVGLLPEASSHDLPKTSIRYDYFKLDRFSVDRRQHLNNLCAKFKKAGKVLETPGAGLYLVDHFIHDFGELGKQWEDEGGSTAYPPPSVQSLLRSLRIPSVPTATKLAIVQYTLMDIVNSIDKSKFEHLISSIGTYHLLPKMTENQTKVIKGLWHLDHSFYEEGLHYLLDRAITVSDLSEGLHRAILRLLFFEGKEKLALRYLRLKNPPLSLPDDLKLEMSLLLANKLTSEAYHFQQRHTYLRETLLHLLFTECLLNGEVGKIIRFPLEESEVKYFDNLLAKNRCQRNDDLRVLLLLSRSKFNEAKLLHERLLASSGTRNQLKASNREMIVNGLASTLCPISKEIFLQKHNPNLKNLPEFKSSKPRPLSVYVKTIDDRGFPNFGVSNSKLCASAIACAANISRFIDTASSNSKFKEILGEEPEIISEESSSLWSKQDSSASVARKRVGTWVAGANKRQRMDEEAISKDEDIAAFVGTPLVKRRSRELAEPGTPQSSAKAVSVHSILKSGKTPGTPSRVANEEIETPKKTLRWDMDIPTEKLGGKAAVRKSLLSTSLLSMEEETLEKSKPSTTETPQATDSIKNRLRSHSVTPSSSIKKDNAVWAEIAEEAKAKVLFSLNLPPKKEKRPQPTKPMGPSFVHQINELIQLEILRKESSKEKIIPEAPGEFPSVTDEIAETEEDNVGTLEDEDVEMNESTPSTPSRESKRLRFLDITIGSDEKSLLELSGSPFTTTALSKELREQLRAKYNSPKDESKDPKTQNKLQTSSETIVEPTGKLTSKAIPESQKSSPKKRTSIFKDVAQPSTGLGKDNSIVESTELSSPAKGDDNASVGKHGVCPKVSDDEDDISVICSPQAITRSTISSMDLSVHAEKSPQKVQVSFMSVASAGSSSRVEIPIKTSSCKDTDAEVAEREVHEIESSSIRPEPLEATKSTPSKDEKLNAFAAQNTPQITSVVSLSRSNYADDEDEVGSEDPEEAEIPPVMEFSQPEEGLVIDASYALKEHSDALNDAEGRDENNELNNMARVVDEKPENDSDSSVICLDSDSEEQPKNQTQLDYDEYEEDSYSLDSEDDGNNTSRGRRSFFHDKYNAPHQDESEEPPSPEYSTSNDEKRDSDVDLYNMDDLDDDPGMQQEDELEDEIFVLGRGLQTRKDSEVGSEAEDEGEAEEEQYSEADEDDDDDEEDEDEEEDLYDEEEEEDMAEIVPSKPSVSQSTGLMRKQPKQDDDGIQEIISSGEEEDAACSKVAQAQLSQDTESGSSTRDSDQLVRTRLEPDKYENQDTESSMGGSKGFDEDQAAVDAILGYQQPLDEDTNVGVREETVSSEPKSNNIKLTDEPSATNCEQDVSTPSKSDVIDILNMSQGQMFFGSPNEVRICDTPPDRALFQLGVNAVATKDRVEKKLEGCDSKSDAGPLNSAVSEDNLVLRLEESDVLPESSPQTDTIEASEDLEMKTASTTKSLDSVGDRSNSVMPASSVGPVITVQKVSDEHQQRMIVTQKDNIQILSESKSNLNVPELQTPDFSGPELSTKSVVSIPAARDSTSNVPTLQTINVQLLSPAKRLIQQTEASEINANQKPITVLDETSMEIKAPTINQQFDAVEVMSVEDAAPSHNDSKKCSSLQTSPLKLPSTSDKGETQAFSLSCQADTATNALTEVKSPEVKPSSIMKSFICQTTFSETATAIEERVSSKSFSCQAAMDTTVSAAITENDGVKVVCSPSKQLFDSISSSCQTTVIEVTKSSNNDNVSTEPEVQKESIERRESKMEGVEKAEDPNKIAYENVTQPMDSSIPQNIIEPPTPFKIVEKNLSPNSSIPQIVIEPPTPFKTVETSLSVGGEEIPAATNPQKAEMSELGVTKLYQHEEESEPQVIDDDSMNPCDVAFVGDTSIASLAATPKTPRRTPLRKSVRLSRMSTPGRALVPDEEVNVSDSVLDVAVLDVEVSDEKPVLVNKSMITDKHGVDKTIVDEALEVKVADEYKTNDRPHESSKDKSSREKDVSEDPKHGKTRPRRSSSVDPDIVRKNTEELSKNVATYKRSSVAKEVREEDKVVGTEEQARTESRDASSGKPETTNKHQKSRHSSASSVDSDPGKQASKARDSREERSKGRRRSSSVQAERDAKMHSEKDKHSRRAQSVEHEGSREKESKTDRRKSSSHRDERRSSDRESAQGSRRRTSGSVEQESSRQKSSKSDQAEAASQNKDSREPSHSHRRGRSESAEPEPRQRRAERSASSSRHSERSSNSESSEAPRDRRRRHSSMEPEPQQRRRDLRRASSEGPSSDGWNQDSSSGSLSKQQTSGSSRKRLSYSRGSTSDTPEDSASPPKQIKFGKPCDAADNSEYRKRKIRHSITEPLEKKKHQHEGPSTSLEEPRVKIARRSEPSDDPESSSVSSGRPRRARSLHEYPVRRSVRPGALESIQELPEDSPRATTMRRSEDDLSALSSLMTERKRIDISKWMALSASQVAKVRRLSGKNPAPRSPQTKKSKSLGVDLSSAQPPLSPALATPVRGDGELSPTGSVASTASSKVLRSGRIIDENTPTKRTRALTPKQQATRTLKFSAASPAKVLRSGRAVGDEDRLTATSDGEDDGNASVNTSLSSVISVNDHVEQSGPGVSVEDMMASRRLTRHQRSILETSMSARARLSPIEASPSPTPKKKSKK